MRRAVEIRERKNVSINMLTAKIIANHINSFHFSWSEVGQRFYFWKALIFRFFWIKPKEI